MSFASLISLPQRSSFKVCGELREVLFWPCTSGRPRAVLLLIPGNPGLIDFYIDFCNELHAQFPKELDIIGTSHLGHTRFNDNRGQKHRSTKPYGLEDQVTNMLAMFDQIDQTYMHLQPRMLLCGHSVGCYVAQRIVAERTDRVHRVFSLFPAIDKIADTPRGKQLWLLFRPGARQLVAAAVDMLRWLLPTRAIFKLASLSKSLGESNTRVVVDKMLHGPCINSILKMAVDEMQKIVEVDEDLYAKEGEKFVMYYGTNDMWVPKDRYIKMRNINTKGIVRLCNLGISHAFVTTHSAEMARVMIEMLTKDKLGAEMQKA
ncbi:hypothetical protein IW140_002496 [Coemansia sp. RSA 1813]|nr:hypothetical protein EV178_001931 [Coemansia sp. RSA 1646]KAJ1770811.1 hypothetical protein LPJ74_002874 [Coemansia sp. RSA 1843]KAJ2091025.1 hypothetical protein IW138_002219 [Coemansia sp. RSA 986]KAJ2215935.1 hypothetical protein EV179_001763 [Coemansia sp. RSA 487]KAJ2570220.1 hypothetical protein IW140_002496 [Coemansia sp. RSA 1813]